MFCKTHKLVLFGEFLTCRSLEFHSAVSHSLEALCQPLLKFLQDSGCISRALVGYYLKVKSKLAIAFFNLDT